MTQLRRLNFTVAVQERHADLEKGIDVPMTCLGQGGPLQGLSHQTSTKFQNHRAEYRSKMRIFNV
jgi:hypothetical protein